jgi:branched-chain amino acid transport system permease protein
VAENLQLTLSYLDQVLIFVCFALSLNLLQGYAGQVSVAHAAFGAVGGYTLAYLVLNAHMGASEALVLGTLGAAFVGVLVALPALRLTTEWLILLTLAVQTIILSLVTTVSALGGTYGLQNVSGLKILGHELDQPTDMFPFFLALTVLVYAVCWRIGESPYGRVLRGIREDEIACRSLGKNVFLFKTVVFGITAGMAGLAGAMQVINISVASPPLFAFDQSSTMVAMVVVGGAGNLLGSIVGVAVLVLLGPLFEHVLNFGADAAALWRLIAFGVVLIVVLLFRPAGLLPDKVTRNLGKKLAKMATDPGAGTEFVPHPDLQEMHVIEEHVRPQERVTVMPRAVAVSAAVSNGQAVASGTRGDVVLKVTGLSKRFGGITAAENLDMELRRGTITALVGPNGAGKTTVFNLLTGAIRPDSGEVYLGGEPIVGLTPDKIAKRGMARSFQAVRIFPRLSVLENVALGVQHQPGESLLSLFGNIPRTATVEREVRERSREWLSFVGMAEFADQPAGGLAFGQQKLVALARVLATEAEVLLLDEPASGIDFAWVNVMLGLIEQIREQGRTVCIVEHNLHVVERLADHTYFMELGRITAQGSFAELTTDKRLAEAYFGTA